MYTAIILDDEEKGRHSLKKFLVEYCPEIEIVGIASSGEQAYDIISKLRPQILFFDIEIAQASSEYTTTFDLLPDLPKYNYEIVFVTAYEHYALQAIRSHAIGYVLKPISITDLIECVNGVMERLQSNAAPDRFSGLVEQLKTEQQLPKRIWIHSQKDVVPVIVSDIVRLEAKGTYTDILCDDGTVITSSKYLGTFSEILEGEQFIKIHRSHLVNTDKIKIFSKLDGGSLTAMDGLELPVSKAGKERLMGLL